MFPIRGCEAWLDWTPYTVFTHEVAQMAWRGNNWLKILNALGVVGEAEAGEVSQAELLAAEAIIKLHTEEWEAFPLEMQLILRRDVPLLLDPQNAEYKDLYLSFSAHERASGFLARDFQGGEDEKPISPDDVLGFRLARAFELVAEERDVLIELMWNASFPSRKLLWLRMTGKEDVASPTKFLRGLASRLSKLAALQVG